MRVRRVLSKTVSKFALAASIALAAAFTVSCTSDIETAEEFLAKLSSSSQGYSSSSVAASSSSAVLSSSSLMQSSSSSAPSSSSALPSSSSVSSVVYGTPVTYEGETYPTVVIGTQTWFAKNLNYDTGISACYSNQASNCSIYGRLYDRATALTVCPSGWHLPNDDDWDKLFRYVDGTSGTASPYDSPTAGRYLKVTHWRDNVGGSVGTDDYGFSALPGGYGYNGNFYEIGDRGNWWIAIEDDGFHAYSRSIYFHNAYAFWSSIDGKSDLFSVRCIKD